ncbi:16S rRNA (cytosine(1402)-N(4))-methyltransferase RsmH [Candidatus Falkowbacteria bacterium]|nr:16S rRNA (cytosine(1402)-N(4))-methyltransferase RsmH [Candidatus Falkowbacteria bacterium]
MYHHTSVLKKEVIKYLNPVPGQNFIDCTLGGAGHAEELAKKVLPLGQVLGIDLDEESIKHVKSKKIPNLVVVNANYKDLEKIIHGKFNHHPINGILLDLGFSQAQLTSPNRGFSFRKEEELDMRFTRKQETEDGRRIITAKDIINTWPEGELTRIFKQYGEEPNAKKIAKAIVRARKIQPINTTFELSKIVVGQKNNKKSGFSKGSGKLRSVCQKRSIHPATRVFQALRIETNNELKNLKQILPQCVRVLEPGGRLGIISFHSLEDRIVKQFFVHESRDCLCPPAFPICRCGHEAALKIITKKPITPAAQEVKDNPRSRSAKFRVVEKKNNK